MLFSTPPLSEVARRSLSRASTRRLQFSIVLVTLVALVLLGAAANTAQAAQPPVDLKTAKSFALLAGSEITNTGPSTINGDLGLHPGTAVSGFPPGTLNGAMHLTDAVAGIAKNDLTTAYNDAAGRTPALSVPADLGGLTATPGVYSSGSSLGLTGAMTLDAQGDPNAVFIFKAGSSLTTASASQVNLINGAQACNVFWQIGSSATLGTSSVFNGNILALTSVSLNNAVTVHGRVLARNGAVTLINDTINRADCAAGTVGGPGGPEIGDSPAKKPGANPGQGSAIMVTTPRWIGQQIQRDRTDRCVDRSFKVKVNGLRIRRVVFMSGKRVIARRDKAPFTASIPDYAGGTKTIRALVYFTDNTPRAVLRLRFKACGEASSAVPIEPVGFTG